MEETVVELVSVPEFAAISIVTDDCRIHRPAEEPAVRDMDAVATKNLWDTISGTSLRTSVRLFET